MAENTNVVVAAGGAPTSQRHQLTDAELEAVRRFEEKVVRIHPGRDPRNPQRMLYRVVAFVGPGANLASTSSRTSPTAGPPSKRTTTTQRNVPNNTDESGGGNADEEDGGASYYDVAQDDDDDEGQDETYGRGRDARGGTRQTTIQQPTSSARRGKQPPAAATTAIAAARDADEDDINEEKETITFGDMEVLGAGSFGSVYRISLLNDDTYCAIKKVFQDVRYKNRELSIMRRLKHINVVKLRYYFYTKSSTSSQQHQQQHSTQQQPAAADAVAIPGVDLNLILEFVPDTLYTVVKHFYSREKRPVPPIYIAVFMYQIFKALNYLHNCHGICHRDIKPQNILCSIDTGICKVCDFGSAKRLRDGEANVAYICSRYYRAPELIFGLAYYTCSIDLWSTACVMAEVMLGSPIFPGSQPLDQIVEIIKIRGTPSADEIMAMNPKYENRNLPQVQRRPLRDLFQHYNTTLQQQRDLASSQTGSDSGIVEAAITLLDQLFSYDPSRRPGALDILMSSLFECLRIPNARLPNGQPVPALLFSFTRWEQSCMRSAKMRNVLMPEHITTAAQQRKVSSGGQQRVPQQHKRSSPSNIDDELVVPGALASDGGPSSFSGSTSSATRRKSNRTQPHDSVAIAASPGPNDGRNPPMPTPRPAAATAGPGSAATTSGATGVRTRSSVGTNNRSNAGGGEFEAERIHTTSQRAAGRRPGETEGGRNHKSATSRAGKKRSKG